MAVGDRLSTLHSFLKIKKVTGFKQLVAGYISQGMITQYIQQWRLQAFPCSHQRIHPPVKRRKESSAIITLYGASQQIPLSYFFMIY